MICQATYDSFDAIPEAYRAEFEQVNSKWQLKQDAIPGVGPLFNAGLAANERRAVDQVKKRNDKIRELEGEVTTLQDKLAVVDTPGSVSLSKEDADQWKRYTSLGTPKEIESKLTEHSTLAEKVTQFETAESLSKIAAASQSAGINPEVLKDWAVTSDGLEFFVKTVEQTDTKGIKTNVEVPFVRIEKKGDDGKIQVSERELLPFAKETLPDWKYAALTTVDGKAVSSQQAQSTVAPLGVRLPDLGSTQRVPAVDGEKERPVDRFNKQRESRPSPFAAKTTVPVGNGAGVIR